MFSFSLSLCFSRSRSVSHSPFGILYSSSRARSLPATPPRECCLSSSLFAALPFSLAPCVLPSSFSRCRFKTECSVSPVNFREGRHRIWNISYEMHFYRHFFLKEHHADNLVGELVVIENVEIFGEISMLRNLEICTVYTGFSFSRKLVSRSL